MADDKQKEEQDKLLTSPENCEVVALQPQPLSTPVYSPTPDTPHSYLPLSVVVLVICGLLGVWTLPISIPAVVFSGLVRHKIVFNLL